MRKRAPFSNIVFSASAFASPDGIIHLTSLHTPARTCKRVWETQTTTTSFNMDLGTGRHFFLFLTAQLKLQLASQPQDLEMLMAIYFYFSAAAVSKSVFHHEETTTRSIGEMHFFYCKLCSCKNRYRSIRRNHFLILLPPLDPLVRVHDNCMQLDSLIWLYDVLFLRSFAAVSLLLS